jgi:hypothetical protein
MYCACSSIAKHAACSQANFLMDETTRTHPVLCMTAEKYKTLAIRIRVARMLYVRAAGRSKLGFVFLVVKLEAMVDIYIDTNACSVPKPTCRASVFLFWIHGLFRLTSFLWRQNQQYNKVTRHLGQLCMFWACLAQRMWIPNGHNRRLIVGLLEGHDQSNSLLGLHSAWRSKTANNPL